MNHEETMIVVSSMIVVDFNRESMTSVLDFNQESMIVDSNDKIRFMWL